MNTQGHVFKYPDNVDTDVIIPARYLNTANAQELALHCMEDIDTGFVKQVKSGDVMVAGWNFGCGSSREHAALAPLHLGVRMVIAKSFARIHAANLINAGILPVTFENPDDYDALQQGDILQIENIHNDLKNGQLKACCGEKEIILSCPLTDRQQCILLSGGLLNYTREAGI